MKVNNKKAEWKMLIIKKYSFRQTLRFILVYINYYPTVSSCKAQINDVNP